MEWFHIKVLDRSTMPTITLIFNWHLLAPAVGRQLSTMPLFTAARTHFIRYGMGSARDDTVKPSRKHYKAPTIPARFEPKFWSDSDLRLARVKAIRHRYEMLKEHCNGDSSYQRDLLCQRVAFISVILETNEVSALSGGGLELGAYIQAANGLLGLLKALGLERHVKKVGDLRTYLEAQERKAG
jgi:hypothetical protein